LIGTRRESGHAVLVLSRLLLLPALLLSACTGFHQADRVPITIEELETVQNPGPEIEVFQLELRSRGKTKSSLINRLLGSQPADDFTGMRTVTAKVGKPIQVEIVREFIYPTRFEPPARSDGTIIPTTPTTFETQKLGLTLELTAQQVGSALQFSGKLIGREFDGFIQGAGELYHPITATLDGRTVLITENVVNSPVFTVRETGIQIAALENRWYSYPIALPTGMGDLELRWSRKRPDR